ncbi:Hypothetical protein D9617_23g005030 [Elsinoe fawcettii]|nr:Hypothetical protein D9617_23g005030 [Elsinoe fawcettii]
MAEVCLKFLCMEDLAEYFGKRFPEIHMLAVQSLPCNLALSIIPHDDVVTFFKYAATNWLWHFRYFEMGLSPILTPAKFKGGKTPDRSRQTTQADKSLFNTQSPISSIRRRLESDWAFDLTYSDFYETTPMISASVIAQVGLTLLAGITSVATASLLGPSQSPDADVTHSLDENGDSLLHWACRLQSTSSEERRMQYIGLIPHLGADVNARNYLGYTPLHVACKTRNWSMAQLLLHHGADANAEDVEGRSPLMSLMPGRGSGMVVPRDYATTADFIVLLVDAGADINAVDQHGETLLRKMLYQMGSFALQGDVSAIEIALQHGARVLHDRLHRRSTWDLLLHNVGNHVGDVWWKPTHRFIMEAALTEAETTTTAFDLLVPAAIMGETLGTSALHLACWKGDVAGVKLLIEHGATVNSSSYTFGTPLEIAAIRGHRQLIALLLVLGASPTVSSMKYGSILAAAAMNPFEARAITAYMKGAGANASSEGYEAYRAAETGNIHLLEEYISAGMPFDNAVGFWGTPLQVAAYMSHKEVFELLVRSGARCDQSSPRGSALSLWLHFNNYDGLDSIEVCNILLSHSEPDRLAQMLDEALLVVCEQGEAAYAYDVAHLLLTKGANPNASGRDGTALQLLVSGDDTVELTRLICYHGADVSTCGPLGSPLLTAAWWLHPDHAKVLLGYGANINELGVAGSALHVLLYGIPNGLANPERQFPVIPSDRNGGPCTRCWDLLKDMSPTICKLSSSVNLSSSDCTYVRMEGIEIMDVEISEADRKVGIHSFVSIAEYQRTTTFIQILIDNGADVFAPGPYGSAVALARRWEEGEVTEMILRAAKLQNPDFQEYSIPRIEPWTLQSSSTPEPDYAPRPFTLCDIW